MGAGDGRLNLGPAIPFKRPGYGGASRLPTPSDPPILTGREVAEESPHKALSSSLSPAWPEPPGLPGFPSAMRVGGALLSSPLVLGQPLHPPAQMAVGAIFRALLRWRVPGSLNHLFIGSITCTLRKWLLISQLGPMGTAHPKKAGQCADHRGGRGHQCQGTWTLSSEGGEKSFLRSLCLMGKAWPYSPGSPVSRGVIAISLGIPGLGEGCSSITGELQPEGEGLPLS